MTRRDDVPESEVLHGRRVVAMPSALDSTVWPADTIVLRVAPDEARVVGEGDLGVDDEHALVEDDASLAAVELPFAGAGEILARLCDWEWPIPGEFLSQGLMAGVPVKVWTGPGRVLLIFPSSYLHEVLERLR
jgi:hypothetical protein